MQNKPALSFWQIWNMSFGFLGIQFGWGLQMANMSAIYQMLGAEEAQLPILWLAAPVTGLVVQPIVGYMSDRTWNRMGRRRPYFLAGAICASIALIFMPNSPTLWVAAGLLWILDASVNVSMEPFRAFVADKLPVRQRPRGYAMQSLFIGAGAVMASALPWVLTNFFGVAGTAPEGQIPPAVHFAFYTGAGVFLIAVIWTVVSTPEYPPEDMEAFERMKAERRGVSGFFKELWWGILNMPPTMRQLALAQFFTWMALFCMWIYYSPAIARTVFDAQSGTPEYSALVAQAGQWTGVSFAVYNLVCFFFAFVLLRLARYYSPKAIHMVCLVIGGFSLMSVAVIPTQQLLLVAMVGVGIAWASILAMPYAILSNCLPPEKMGFYMGVFNFFIVLPQIVIAVGLGQVLSFIPGATSVHVMVGGGVAMLLASVFMLRVREVETPAELAPART
ncbi:MFS transporter [Wenzhouxiangella sp. AB-CW3]|uniref:MFS transporter n=1 Tax=Wenzhouxiangella sp. AB-CW3 TaxID=2771012 RepID=UPI00168B45C0|nr:MFS transporter [Wenzhouxiangella sp. AB-CW3]QOC23024.1 MFS transporter [Wenzhouxiangella sp. AB-CW3]